MPTGTSLAPPLDPLAFLDDLEVVAASRLPFSLTVGLAWRIRSSMVRIRVGSLLVLWSHAQRWSLCA